MKKVGESYIQSADKRILDIVGASLLAAGAVPLAAAAATALCLERGKFDPIFRQNRVGLGAVPFLVNKLRTIPEQEAENCFDTFGSADPRASKLGRFIRKVGIDELPQVINVLNGDMSLVGIRPQVDWVLEQRQTVDSGLFEDWHYCYERNLGLFGAGQAYAHQVGSYEETGVVVRDLMILDIEAYQTASLQADISAIVNQPLSLIRTALATV